MSLVIEFTDISNYCGRSLRPIEEGSLIARGENLAQVACTQRNKHSVQYTALCLQTSNMNDKPHTIDLSIEIIGVVKQLSAKCTCKANIKMCKHIVGLMLKLMNTNPNQMDILSRTDVTQCWGKYSGRSLQEFKPKPIHEMACCYSKNSSKLPDSIPSPEPLENFLQAFPNSILSLVLNSETEQLPNHRIQFPQHTLDFDEIFPSDVHYVSDIRLEGPRHIVKFYYEFVHVDFTKAKEIFERTRGQSNMSWIVQRKLRITGSIGHHLYTYSSKPRERKLWIKKLNTTVFPSFQGNKYTRFGHRNEKVALRILEQTLSPYEKMYTNCGLIIDYTAPWFAVSPDGFLQREIPGSQTRELILLEVKCIFPKKKEKNEKIDSVHEFVSKLKFLIYKEKKKTYELRVRNKFYTQIQLSLFVTNLHLAKLIIFYKKLEAVICIDVKRNDKYCTMVTDLLSQCYATHMLPFLSQKKHRNYFIETKKTSTSRNKKIRKIPLRK